MRSGGTGTEPGEGGQVCVARGRSVENREIVEALSLSLASLITLSYIYSLVSLRTLFFSPSPVSLVPASP